MPKIPETNKRNYMKKKNLIFFLPNFSYGGAGNSILNICKNLDKKKYDIYIISLQKNFYRKELIKFCKEVKEIEGSSTLFSLNKINKYLESFDKTRTLIISNINYANTLFVFFFKILKKYKLVIIERTPLQELVIYYGIKDLIKKFIIKIFVKLFYNKVDCLIANSKKTAQDYEKIIKKKCFFVYPLSFKKRIRVKKKKKIKKEIKILTIARLSREKNLEDQIYALKKINNPKFSLSIVGDGILKKKLKNLIKKLKVNCKIFYYSEKTKKKLLKQSDLYVCSSDFEGFPNTVVEAINYGLPVISSKNHGGINEILLNGLGGDYYKSKNIEDLSNKIIKVVKSYAISLRKNKVARDKLIRFSEKNIEKYEKIFDKILIK